MSIARHHADWLRLVEASGPFVSMDVLCRTFPQGLEARDPAQARALREAWEIWQDNPAAPGCQRAWVMHVLTNLLGYPAELLVEGQALPAGLEAPFPEHSETLRPDMALIGPAGAATAGKAQLLIVVCPPAQALEKPLLGKHWKATPATRMMELLHASEVPLGLLTNGDHWMLVYAPRGETTGYAPWFAWLWLDEPITLRAFHSLLGLRRFFGVAEKETLLGMLQESAKNQQEVTDQLGYQVREAVEVLVQSIDALDREHGGALLHGVAPAELYNAALTVMMRLVFLFCAEERGLLHLGKPLYDDNYAVSTLLEQLQEAADRHGEEVLERRFDAWARLLAAFRAVHGGIQHQDLLLPAYGGSLFDPDRYPFLEGRPQGSAWRTSQAEPLKVNNRVALHLLSALQRLRVKVPGGGPAETRPVSFSALGVEQIGHVYEGLLDHTARRASEPVLGLQGTRSREPEIPLSVLEALLTKGQDKLLDYLKGETGRSLAALKKAFETGKLHEEHKLLIACGHDDALLARVREFAGLIRDDSFERPMIVLPGSTYVTAGTDRRDSGTQYTPPSFTEPVVRYALEPLVYEGPAEGLPKEEWKLRTARELLELKICDMAMGSGAFLVQTVRYLAERLMESWINAEASALAAAESGVAPEARALDTAMRNVLARPSSRKFLEKFGEELEAAPALATEQSAPSVIPRITPEGQPATGAAAEQLVPADEEERRIYAQRIVTDRCIYGIDINPMAVEMAKLSLWLTTMDKARAFTFLDHALKCGDALLGLCDARQVHKFHLDPEGAAQGGIWGDHLHGVFQHAMAKRRELESFTVRDIRDAEHKSRLLQEADEALAAVKTLCDLLIAAAVSTADGNAAKRGTLMTPNFEKHRHRIFDALMAANSQQEVTSAFDAARYLAAEGHALLNAGNPNPDNPRKPFHWVLEFPEVFGDRQSAPGFSCIVGNPPFMGGLKLESAFGADWRAHLVDCIAKGRKGVRGTGDLCAYFLLRASQILTTRGIVGFITTNTIAQGDTREIGLEQMLGNPSTIYRAISSRNWPGVANLEISELWLRKNGWDGTRKLNGEQVKGITSALRSLDSSSIQPMALAENSDNAFVGALVVGMGFILERLEATELIDSNPRNAEVVLPYLNGEDLNSSPRQLPSRWVINFFGFPLDRATAPEDYDGPVAEDYPECLRIVRERVLPDRLAYQPKNPWNRKLRSEWWLFGQWRWALYKAISQQEKVLVRSRVASINSIAFAPTDYVFSDAVVVFAYDDMGAFALLQSFAHTIWLEEFASSLRTDIRYTPSSCFDTFPWPNVGNLTNVGQTYYDYRSHIMESAKEGLTKTYNRFNDPTQLDSGVVELRRMHSQLDQTVASTYGWADLDLQHGFHETRYGIRYTISEAARREVLDRLLALNHERYEEEVKAGLHDKGAKKKESASSATAKRGQKAKATGQGELF